MFSDVFSQCATSSGGTRSEIAVTAPPQTCVSTGPVAHWAPMSGPALAAAAAWNVAMKVSVACSTTLIEMLGFFATYAVTAAAIALFAPGASASPQNHMVRLTFSPLAAALVAPEAAASSWPPSRRVLAIGRAAARGEHEARHDHDDARSNRPSIPELPLAWLSSSISPTFTVSENGDLHRVRG